MVELDQMAALMGFFIALVVLISLGLPTPPEPPTDPNQTPEPPATVPFPEGASQEGIQEDVLFEQHNQRLTNAESIIFEHSTQVALPETANRRRQVLKRTEYAIAINRSTQETLVFNRTEQNITQHYRTGNTVYHWSFLNQSTAQTTTQQPLPSVGPETPDSQQAAARYRSLLSLDNTTYSGVEQIDGEQVHVYTIQGDLPAADSELGTGDGQFVAGEYKLYVHPTGYFYGAEGSYLVRNETHFREYTFTEITQGINDTVVERPIWANTSSQLRRGPAAPQVNSPSPVFREETDTS